MFKKLRIKARQRHRTNKPDTKKIAKKREMGAELSDGMKNGVRTRDDYNGTSMKDGAYFAARRGDRGGTRLRERERDKGA